MPSDAASADAYEVVLADLRARRSQIDAAIAAIEALKGTSSLTPTSAQGVQPLSLEGVEIRPGSFHGMSIAEAAKAVLAARKAPMGTVEIATAIVKGGVVMTSANIPNTVGSILNRQSKTVPPDVVSVSRGKWGLAAWYPNPGRFQKRREIEKTPGPVSSAESAVFGLMDDLANDPSFGWDAPNDSSDDTPE